MLRELAYPFVALGLAILFLILSRIGVLPPQDVLLEGIGTLVKSTSGLWLVAIAALESTVAINVYFPGALVILASMAATKGSANLIVLVYIFVTTGQMIGYSVSFLAGYYMRRKTSFAGPRPDQIASRSVASLVLSTYWHPHSAALTSFNLGSQACSPLTFGGWAVVGVLVWGAFWTWACLNGINVMIRETPWDLVFLVYVFGWVAWIVLRHRWGKSTFIVRSSTHE